MKWMRFRLAALVALFIGFPLTERLLASGFDIFSESLDLTFAIADASDGS